MRRAASKDDYLMFLEQLLAESLWASLVESSMSMKCLENGADMAQKFLCSASFHMQRARLALSLHFLCSFLLSTYLAPSTGCRMSNPPYSIKLLLRPLSPLSLKLENY